MDAVIVALIQPFRSFNSTIKFISSFHGLVNLPDSYKMKVAALSQISSRRALNAAALADLSVPALICLLGWDFVSFYRVFCPKRGQTLFNLSFLDKLRCSSLYLTHESVCLAIFFLPCLTFDLCDFVQTCDLWHKSCILWNWLCVSSVYISGIL